MMACRKIFCVVSYLVGFASCFQFHYSNGVTKTWANAKLDCESRGMELAVLDTPEKYQEAKNYMLAQSTNPTPNDVYTGISLDTVAGYPPYVYRYPNGVQASYLPWGAGEPDNQNTDFCLRMKQASALAFHTIGCNNPYDYLCTQKYEYPGYNTCGARFAYPSGAPGLTMFLVGELFYYSNGNTKTWTEAKSDCESRGMVLAIIDTAEKHQAAKEYMFSQSGNNMPNDVFTGISLETSMGYPPYVYRFTNGVQATYLPWGPGEPDNQNTDFCLRMRVSSALAFHTIKCGSKYDYLCTLEYPEPVPDSTYQSTDGTEWTTKKPFPGTIFVSGAVIGIAVGAASACCGICLLCVFCRFCRRGKDDDEKMKPEPAKANSVVPNTIASYTEFAVNRVKPQYIP